jgi:FKBP-type peptidyl-prolyl cis-trans isomerase
LRRTGFIKVGAATVAAGAGVILALTSVMAHTSQAAALHVPSKSGVASIMNTIEDKQDAAEAAALLAREQAKAAKAAAKLQREAAAAAEEAAETSATEANEDSTTVTETDTDNDNETEGADTEVDNDTDQTETHDTTDTQDATDTESGD